MRGWLSLFKSNATENQSKIGISPRTYSTSHSRQNKEKKRYSSPRLCSYDTEDTINNSIDSSQGILNTKSRLRSRTPSPVDDKKALPTPYFYKVFAKILECRYRQGLLETVYSKAVECKAYYSKDGKEKSIYYDENSADLVICLLFSTYGNARNFQNVLLNLQTHPEFLRRVAVEKRIFEEHHFNGFSYPEPVQFQDCFRDSASDSMPFLSVDNLVCNEEDNDFKPINKNALSLLTSSSSRSSSPLISIRKNRQESFMQGSVAFGYGEDSSAADDDSRSKYSINSAPAIFSDPKLDILSSNYREGRVSSLQSPSTRSVSSSPPRRSNNGPLKILQSFEALSPTSKLTCYACSIVSEGIDPIYLEDPDNIIYGTWLFKQYFFGLLRDDSLPELSIKYEKTDTEELLDVGGNKETRTKVHVTIRFREPSLAKALAKQFKDGTVKVDEGTYESYLYAYNASTLRYCLETKYAETIGFWKKNEEVEVIDVSLAQPAPGFDD